MSTALNSYKTQFAGNTFSEELLHKGEKKLEFISYQLAWLTFAIVAAAFVGSFYSTVMFFWGIVCLYNDFRHQILEMRHGRYPEGCKEIPIIKVTPLTGYIFSNSLIAFAFNLLISTLVLIPVFWILTYQWIWENKFVLASIVLFNIWDIAKPGLVKKFVINETGIVNRRLLAAY